MIPKFNPNQRSRLRPQTPQPYYHHHLGHQGYPHPPQYFIPQQNIYQPNLTRSRMSIGSTTSAMNFIGYNDQNEMFPEDLVFLLKNEDRNLNNFKQKIQKQKAKVDNDFEIFKNEIEHIIQDAKISVQAELDIIYRSYISKYSQLKKQIQQVRKLRKQILAQNPNIVNLSNPKKLQSNKDLIEEIQKDAEQFRNYKIYGYLSELIKEKIKPMLEKSTELVIIGSTQIPFYRNKQLNDQFKSIKFNFSQLTSTIYTQLQEFIISPSSLIEKEKLKQELANTEKFAEEFGHYKSQFIPTFQQPPFYPYPSQHIVNSQILQPRNIQYSPIVQRYRPQSPPHKHVIQQPPQINIHPNSYPQTPQPQQLLKHTQSQQSMISKWCDNIRLDRIQTVQTDHSQSILCIYFIGQKYIATGSKDKNINIYTIDGKKIMTLRGHQAAICSLSTAINSLNQVFLASGSDHGCSCLIIWDTKQWQIVSRIQAHSAAVTSIVDLCDGMHLVTGSYDKKINLYDFMKGQLIVSLNNNKSSVTNIVLSCDQKRLIASGLDNTLTIWLINRKNNIVQSIVLDRTINTNTLICSIVASQIRPQSVIGGSRDGKLKSFNISNGQVEKNFTINQNSIIDLVLIERQMKIDSPIALSCSSKDKTLVMTKMQNGVSSYIGIDNNIGIQFGCGIGPKIVMHKVKGGIMAIANQSNLKKQFSLYKITPN